MWYEEENQYVRAPTPKTFDNLVEDLEARDSVLFESISLPSTGNRSSVSSNLNKSLNKSTKGSFVTSLSRPLTPQDSLELPSNFDEDLKNSLSLTDLDLGVKSTDSISFKKQAMEEAIRLQKQIDELEFTLREKEVLIEEKKDLIAELQEQLSAVQTRPRTTQDATFRYKDKYQATLKELNALKDVLQSQGKIRIVKAKSARLIEPEIRKK